jgi:small GTP-binding protein
VLSEFTYDVFLSHNSRDKAVVRALAKRLKNDGLKVWLDEWEIKPGDPIGLKIEQALEQSRCLVLFMSANAFDSEWVTLERHTVLFRDPTNSQRRFIPLLVEDTPLKDTIRQFAYIDWRKKAKKEYVKLVEACAASIGVAASYVPRRIEPALLLGSPEGVLGVAVTSDGRRAVSCTRGTKKNLGELNLWDLKAGICIAVCKAHSRGAKAVALTPDGRYAVSAGRDQMLRRWDLDTRACLVTLEGHTDSVETVAVTPDGRQAVSGSLDQTLRLWDPTTGKCLATLWGHTSAVHSVALVAGGCQAISASADRTLRLWDLGTGVCLATLEGHTDGVNGVAVTPDGRRAISASTDRTLRLWDLGTGVCVATLEGHTDRVNGVAVTPDGRRAISASADKTLRLWDLGTGVCLATLEGHTDRVNGVAVTPDGRRTISGSDDNTLRLWDLRLKAPPSESDATSARYSNAKVVLVGDSGVGKTGLALRLAENRWEATESTHGMRVYQLKLPKSHTEADIEREVWLWDFAGQPDYRLIHQLYMDETALGVVVFDPQDDNPFESLGHWEKALRAAVKHEPAKLLVAGRCDRGGITVSKRKFQEFRKKHGFLELLTTAAKTGEGCEQLVEKIAWHIPWDRLPWTATTRLFKTLKDAIVRLKGEGTAIIRLAELRQRLQLMLPGRVIEETDLRAVVGLLQGQGLIRMLDFGDFVLLQPEQINLYASVVVRSAREHKDEMGSVPERQVLEGRLDFKTMERLAEADEKTLLRAMTQTLLDRSLCLLEDTPAGSQLVFPSYFNRDRPDLPGHPNVFVTYGFAGPLDEIYSTLVVRLSHTEGFKKDELWKNAADFKTHGGRRVGLSMNVKSEGTAEMTVYFEAGVPDDTKITFIKYIHEHLLKRAGDVTRVRTYVCPKCDRIVENRTAIRVRLERGLKDIICGFCEERVPLLDLIEQKLGSKEFLQAVRVLDERASINIDNQSRELILIGHAFAIAGEAGQIFRPTVIADWGIDGEIEFKDHKGEASGNRVYLQLKSGDSYLHARKRDGQEIFAIKNPRWAEYWQAQAYPVMLVIRTSDGTIRWMNVTEHLKAYGENPPRQIVFAGEPFTALNLVRLRDRLIPQAENARIRNRPDNTKRALRTASPHGADH